MKHPFFSLVRVSSFAFLLATTSPLAFSQEATPSASSTPLVQPTASASVEAPAASPATSGQTNATTNVQPPVTAASPGTPTYRNYSSVHVDGPYIAITFDDGPSPKLTPRLLDMLKKRGIKVTFFTIGENVARYPQVVARAAAEGHEIANHTWHHPALTKLSDERVQEELNKTSDAIFQATGKKPVLVRPPYGAINARLTRMIEQQDGMKVVLWSVDPNDWKRPGSSVVTQRLLAGAKPGAITLSHDIHSGTIDAMPETLDALKAKGYKFVTVSELIALETKKPAPVATPQQKKHKAASKKQG